MQLLEKIRRIITISRSHAIARRYFVVNGFDGALTTLGLIMGFYVSAEVDLKVSINACLGAAIALAVSGFSSAYLSEAAERKREFRKLQGAMVADLSGSAHQKASRWMPVMIALINGLSPLIMALIIIIPLVLAHGGYVLPLEPFELAIVVAFGLIFLLGVFLGSVSGVFWFCSGLQAVLIAVFTAVLIYAVA